MDEVVTLADLVTLGRTAVMKDAQGNPLEAHAPEMPTRFTKQLVQVYRGAVTIGIPVDRALELVRRIATDSMPPLRLACLRDLAENPSSTVSDVRKRLNRPRTSIDRELQCLQLLGLLRLDEIPRGVGGSEWRYSLNSDEHERALRLLEPQTLILRNIDIPELPVELGGAA
jgi:hypothetical protein